MAISSNATLLQHLVNPEVLADYIDEKLIDYIRFAPLATIDRTLEGTAGDEITLPAYKPFIGSAEIVEEGEDIPIARLGTTKAKVKISKIGRAVEISDEALLSGYKRNGANEAANQILLSLNDGVEKRLMTAMDNVTTLTHTIEADDPAADGIADALTKFGEDIDGDKVLLVDPNLYARIRKTRNWIPNTELGAQAIIRGIVGMVHGCQVSVTNRLKAPVHYAKTTDVSVDSGKTYYTFDAERCVYKAVAEPATADIGTYYEKSVGANDTAYIVKPGALSIYMKRDTLVETDRNIINQMNYIVGSKLFAPYVSNENKIIKLNIAAAVSGNTSGNTSGDTSGTT